VNLSQLARGLTAHVRIVDGDPAVAIRLMELGLVPGARVRLVRVAPLGDPLVVALRGAELSLRKAEARLVTIELAP
jgi:Fe2+ transport system protein FeoA